MRIQTIVNDDELSSRIRNLGLRRVAREMKIDVAYLSRVVNNKIVIKKANLEKLKIVINKMKSLKNKHD